MVSTAALQDALSSFFHSDAEYADIDDDSYEVLVEMFGNPSADVLNEQLPPYIAFTSEKVRRLCWLF